MTDALSRTPLYEEHVALGARMVPFAGYLMPVRYAEITAEHRAVRTGVGVFDVCHMAEFRVAGPGAAAGLRSVLTNDIGRLTEVGLAQYTLMCEEDGGVVDDLIVYRTGEVEYLVVANAVNRAAVSVRLQEALAGDAAVADESDRTGLIAIQGPRALDVVRELAGPGHEPPARFRVAEAMLAGVPVLLARTGYTGEDGVEAFCSASRAADLWRVLLSFPEVVPCGLGARDTLRLEMGYPLHGHEIGLDSDPVSAGLGWAVSFDTGGFTGRRALLAIRAEGPRRKLVGLSLALGIPRDGYPVLHGEEQVGTVASGTFSPTLGHGIATAYVPRSLSDAGTVLAVDIRGRRSEAVVTRPPFVQGTSLERPSVA